MAMACAAVAASWLGPATGAGADRFSQREVEATFLYKYANFVEWPRQAFPRADTPITIGVVGEDPFGALLDKLVEGQTVKGRSFAVKRWKRVEDLGPCHILFVAASEKARWIALKEKLKNASVLTVASYAGFARDGGIVNFVREGQSVRFQINQAAAQKVGLRIHGSLLKLARPVSE
jgi:hypothetical protein